MEVENWDDLDADVVAAADAAISDNYDITVANIMATFDLATKIDLKHLVLNARNVEFNPRKFQGAIMRLREPKSTCIIFSTGKVVVVGMKAVPDLEIVARKVESIAQKVGFRDAAAQSLSVRNITASAKAPYPIRLEGLLNEHTRFCTYEPELFPALYYRMKEPNLCFVVFVTGKVVVCGAKTIEEIIHGFSNLMPVLMQHRPHHTATLH
ncbi:hypothetical protein, variant [Aphanomyces invadans]|uniref:TATA-box-binding protein n=1 Tax=Aphanomyces invadans TaxID=157072 RepID=A0A024U739_9STRA|nr:hypothetical protein, variant [Aphanomyces invadans]ETW01712.1 hypothetical protein, variant [Aphanomyces invadans]|eukprot:XP_008869560.1 hypothetical protein, variant [Aphanomyces invadans]